MLKRLLSIGAAALAGLTAACEDGPATTPGGWRSPATWSSMVYASSHGPLWLRIHGNPFGAAAGDDFSDQVAQAMTNQIISRSLALTTNRDQAPQPQLHVVLAFNPPDTLDSRQLCAGQVATAADPRDKITVHAVFCENDRLLASVQGWVAKVSGPDDKRFRQLLGQVTRELFGSPS